MQSVPKSGLIVSAEDLDKVYSSGQDFEKLLFNLIRFSMKPFGSIILWYWLGQIVKLKYAFNLSSIFGDTNRLYVVNAVARVSSKENIVVRLSKLIPSSILLNKVYSGNHF